MTLSSFLGLFPEARRKGMFHYVHCPGHSGDPKTKKLAVWEESGWVKLKCWTGGCSEGDILASLGLQNSDLKTTGQEQSYAYHGRNREQIFRKRRVEKDGKKNFYQESLRDGAWVSGKAELNGLGESLYRLPEVLDAVAAGKTIFLNEGEKACEAIVALGGEATCQPHGANPASWKDDHSRTLSGANVVIVADRDDTGSKYAQHVFDELTGVARSVRIVRSRTIGPKDDAFDHISAEFGLDEFEPADDLMPPAIFKVLSLDDMDAIPDTTWLIDNFLPVRGLGMIYGQPGSGKTFVVLDLCMALIRGPFLFAKEFPVRKECRVVYAAGEKMQGLKVRLRAARKKWGTTSEEAARMKVVRGVPQLFDQKMDASTDKFISEMSDAFPSGIDVLFIDTKHAATIGSEENSASNAGTEIHHARKIQDALGCAVIPVHHSGKSGSSERGSSAWKGAVDILLRIDKTETGERLMVCEKMGDAPDNFTIGFSLDVVADTESLAVDWAGRTEAAPKDIKSECLRILKVAAKLGKPIESRSVVDLFTIDGTNIAVAKALTRLAAQGREKTGVSRTEAHPGLPIGKKNWYLFEYNEDWIVHQTSSPYKDSDDAEEIMPPITTNGEFNVEGYDPFAD